LKFEDFLVKLEVTGELKSNYVTQLVMLHGPHSLKTELPTVKSLAKQDNSGEMKIRHANQFVIALGFKEQPTTFQLVLDLAQPALTTDLMIKNAPLFVTTQESRIQATTSTFADLPVYLVNGGKMRTNNAITHVMLPGKQSVKMESKSVKSHALQDNSGEMKIRPANPPVPIHGNKDRPMASQPATGHASLSKTTELMTKLVVLTVSPLELRLM